MNVFSETQGAIRAELDAMSAALKAELAYVRSASTSPRLSVFYRNAATWELAMLLAISDGDDDASVYNSVEAVSSRALGPSAMLKFIHEQAKAGNLCLEESRVKRSKRILRLDPVVKTELMRLLERRNRMLTAIHVGKGT